MISLFDNQNKIQQELFLIRNNLATASSKPQTKCPDSASQLKETKKQDAPAAANNGPAAPPRSYAKVSKPSASPRLQPTGKSSGTSSIASKPHWSSKASPKSSPVPHRGPPQQNESPKILYIGDSISANVDIANLEFATQAEFITAKAYSSTHETESNIAKQAPKFPDSNFLDVVRKNVNKGNFKSLVIQAGSVDITNLNTMDDPEEHMEYFRQETIRSATNLFQAGIDALKAKPSLTKVLIMKQIPRYDPADVDPLSLKASLSILFNNTLTNLWMESPFKQKMFIGNHNIECNGAIREARYRHTKSGKYDGVHLYGSSGTKAYTLSVLNILRAANITASEHNFHQSCAQFEYQNRKNRNSSDDRKSRGRKPFQQTIFTIPTHNRFHSLIKRSQGN